MTQRVALSLTERARKIKLLVLDVDGVLTNGQLFFSAEGEALKAFHVHDGMGLSLAHTAGIQTAIITGRTSEIVRRRSDELRIGTVFQGVTDKIAALTELMEKLKLTLEQICYIGDDVNDLALLVSVGLGCSVANGVAEAKEAAQFVTQREGGQGAVREVVEMILKAQGKWDNLVDAYRQPGCIGLCQ